MKFGQKLKPGEIEIVWLNGGQTEVIQTLGMTYNAGAIVLQIGESHVIIPMTSVKRFRVPGVATGVRS